ncbi:MAG: SAM-dependent methyltransferase [Ktedonobacterales bacterium]|nr:MAG: SAM-dependent methyltransferase [Ktedonobacterales bacterium]
MSQAHDTWTSGRAYESYVGRWSRLVAPRFLAWLGIAPGARWLDVGCGTGLLTVTTLQMAAPTAVRGVDPSEEYLAYAREHIADTRASFALGTASTLDEADASYDAVISGLMLNFVPEPVSAVAELVRVTRLGGTMAAYVWDYAGKMQFMRYFWDAAVALDPAARMLDEGTRFPICHPSPLATLFREAELHNVETITIDVETAFRDFDDYWSPFLGGQGPAPNYAMSLSEERRVALRERIRASLPIAPDGSIALIARAWAVRGIR